MFIILVADRNKHIRELLKRELSDDGHQVIPAKTAAEVVEIVSTVNPIHLIIIDFDLPDRDSADIMRKLKSRFDDIPVIIHSHGSERQTGFLPSRQIYEIEKGSTSISQIKVLVDQISRRGSVNWGSDCLPGEIHKDKIT
ncbi:MAG: response regulator [Desulfobacteraceae bacterium]|nr:MAG: response regulator [Desulfobacteraceae bacterium]